MSKLPTLVLLPGLDGTEEPRVDFIREIGPRVAATVITYPRDLPLGYAQLESFVRDRVPRGRTFVVLGESFSGPIAIRLAAHPPPGLRGVILCGTFARTPYPALKPVRALAAWAPVRHMPRWLRSSMMWGGRDARHAGPRLHAALATVTARVVRRRINEALAIDVSDALTRVTLPMLILHGTRDRIVPERATRWLLETAVGATAAAIDGPHLLLQARSKECAAPIIDFVERVCGQTAAKPVQRKRR